LRILIYNWRDLAHPKAGGAEVYTDAVARVWVSQGHEVTLFTSSVEGQASREVSPGGYVIIRRGSRLSVYREARRFWFREGRGNFELVIDEVNTKPFGCPQWVVEVPVVALIHQVAREIWSYETPVPVAWLGRYVLEPRWLRRYAKATVVTVSQSSRASLREYGLENVHIVPEGVDDMLLHRCRTEERPMKESTLTLCFVGRLSANKRPQHAIEAFRFIKSHVPDARLWVMGSGPLEEKLKKEAPEGVEFLGRVDDEEKQRRLACSHGLLVTSVREGWGLVVTEAAMVGTPSIGYRVPGLCDSIGVSGGLLTDPKPGALAMTLIAEIPHLLVGEYKGLPHGVQTWTQVANQIMAVVATGQPGRQEKWSSSPSEVSDEVALLRWRGTKADDNDGVAVDVGDFGVPPTGLI